MLLDKYEDFLYLNTKQNSDISVVWGLNASGAKIELIVKAFAALELKLDLIGSFK